MTFRSTFETLRQAPVLAALLFTGGLPALAAEPVPPLLSENSVLMHVEGKPVTLRDVETREIHELRERLYGAILAEMQRAALDSLAKTHPDYATLPEPAIGEAELRAFYDAQRLQRQGTFEALAPHIAEYLQRQVQLRNTAAQYEQAVAKGLVRDHLLQPGEFLVRVPLESAFVRGNTTSEVMLLEFSDFQCPFCARLQPMLNGLLEDYGARVAFAYRHFPLSIHQEADEAAVAVECARDQGRFEAFHNLLFANQRRQYVPDLKKYARLASVPDLERFDRCLDDDVYRDRVKRDMEVGLQVGVNGTPTVIVGRLDAKSGILRGEIISGVRSEADYRTLLDKYLALAKR